MYENCNVYYLGLFAFNVYFEPREIERKILVAGGQAGSGAAKKKGSRKKYDRVKKKIHGKGSGSLNFLVMTKIVFLIFLSQVNGYNCTCAPGWEDVHCGTEILECASDPCQNNALCVENVGFYQCECVVGFTGGK